MPPRIPAEPRNLIYVAAKRTMSPQAGAYGLLIVRTDGIAVSLSGSAAISSKRLLLLGIREAGETLKGQAAIVISSDSNLVRVGKDLPEHRQTNFRSLENDDLWREIDALMGACSLTFRRLGTARRDRHYFDRARALAATQLTKTPLENA